MSTNACQAVRDRLEHTTGLLDEAGAPWLPAAANEIQANGGVVMGQVGEAIQIQRIIIGDAIRSMGETAGEADAWRWRQQVRMAIGRASGKQWLEADFD